MRAKLFVLLGLMGALLMVSCAQTEKEHAAPEKTEMLMVGQMQQAGETVFETEAKDEMPEAYQDYPYVLANENQRFVDENEILHIDLLSQNIPLAKSKSTVDDLFPNCQISYNPASTGIFDVFDVECANKDFYTAVVTYEQDLREEYEIAFIFVQNKAFSMKMLEKLFE